MEKKNDFAKSIAPLLRFQFHNKIHIILFLAQRLTSLDVFEILSVWSGFLVWLKIKWDF
jgi:hypothetical protein